jgi:hypothetical protein
MLAKALTRVVIGWLSSGIGGETLNPTDYQVENYFSMSPEREYGLLGDAHVETKLWRVLKAIANAPASETEKRARAALRILLLRDHCALPLWMIPAA